MRLLLLGRAVEELLEQAELAVAPDERWFEAGRPSLAAAVRDHALCPPELRRFALALQLVGPCVLVGDRGVAGPASQVTDQDRSGLGGRLDPGGGVDEVACDH